MIPFKNKVGIYKAIMTISMVLIPILLISWLWLPNPANVELFYIKLVLTDLIVFVTMAVLEFILFDKDITSK